MEFIENFLGQVDNILLVVLGLGAFISGLLMLFLRDPMQVALSLISAMLCLGGIYGLIGAHFIAAFQILIYVGAVMVFMIYVIMLLNSRDSSLTHRYSRYRPYAIAVAIIFAIVFVVVFINLDFQSNEQAASFTVSYFSKVFLSEYWFQFQLIAVLLLVSVISAIALLRTPFTKSVNNNENSEVKGG